jgi:hypothetical protein
MFKHSEEGEHFSNSRLWEWLRRSLATPQLTATGL